DSLRSASVSVTAAGTAFGSGWAFGAVCTLATVRGCEAASVRGASARGCAGAEFFCCCAAVMVHAGGVPGRDCGAAAVRDGVAVLVVLVGFCIWPTTTTDTMPAPMAAAPTAPAQ